MPPKRGLAARTRGAPAPPEEPVPTLCVPYTRTLAFTPPPPLPTPRREDLLLKPTDAPRADAGGGAPPPGGGAPPEGAGTGAPPADAPLLHVEEGEGADEDDLGASVLVPHADGMGPRAGFGRMTLTAQAHVLVREHVEAGKPVFDTVVGNKALKDGAKHLKVFMEVPLWETLPESVQHEYEPGGKRAKQVKATGVCPPGINAYAKAMERAMGE